MPLKPNHPETNPKCSVQSLWLTLSTKNQREQNCSQQSWERSPPSGQVEHGVSVTSCTRELPVWTSRNLSRSFQSLKTFRYRELESAGEQKALGTVTLLGWEGKCAPLYRGGSGSGEREATAVHPPSQLDSKAGDLG